MFLEDFLSASHLKLPLPSRGPRPNRSPLEKEDEVEKLWKVSENMFSFVQVVLHTLLWLTLQAALELSQ